MANFNNLRKRFLILSWALYDLANQFFALNVVSLYFVRWLTLERNIPEIFYSISFGISLILVALFSPIFGTISDITHKRRSYLVFFTLLSIYFTSILGLSQSVFLALVFFAIANYGCQMAIIFYNAQLSDISPPDKIGLISGLGRMFGYSGAILALFIFKPIVLKSGYQAVFLPTALLFLFFSLPCMIFVKDKPFGKKINLNYYLKIEKIPLIFKRLKEFLLIAYKTPVLLNFLKATFFSLCAVNTVILFMSVYISRVFGLGESEIINLICFSTLFAIIGSFFSGIVGDLWGYRNCLIFVSCLWIISFLFGALARSIYLFWLIGSLMGMALGSTWTILRALTIRLIPRENAAEIFGLSNLVGYLSAIVGALFWGIIIWFLSPLGELGYRISLLSQVLFMVLGICFLLRIPKDL
jgi:UMF1 family MFS transporter